MKTQILQLLTSVAAYSDQHLSEIECNLMQLDALHDEAIKKLCASFIAMQHAVTLQQQTLSGMLLSGNSLAEYAAQVETVQRDISHHARDAIAGLQFQDMTSQIIDRMVLHLSGVRDVLGALDTGAVSLSEEPHDCLPGMLNDLNDRVGAHRADLTGTLRSTVNQQHMGSGEIELF
jgi:hypothetical protein